MEITQQQFETNFETLQDEEKAMVAGLIENNEPTTLQAFAKVLGITFDLPEPEPMQEPQEPMPEPSEEISEPEQEIPQTDEMSPITRELMALGDQPTEPVGITGPIQKEGADNSGVADDVLMDAEQKSFIVNAAALKLFGYGDFVNRILKPNIKSLKERTGQMIELATITQPQQQVQGDTPIAASNKELYIPPLLAEEIGYELLEKINNRGKPKTEKKLEEQKQKEQPQEPQAAMQAALGKRIGMRNGGGTKKIKASMADRDEIESDLNYAEQKSFIVNPNEERKKQVQRYLESKGLRQEAVAGIMANIKSETGGSFNYKEKEVGKKKGGRGLFQFTGNMLRDYNNYRGGMDDSMEFQIDFVLDMIDQRADKPDLPSFFKLSDIGIKNRKTLRNAFRTQDAKTIARLFMDKFENPLVINKAIRDAYKNDPAKAAKMYSAKGKSKTIQQLTAEYKRRREAQMSQRANDAPLFMTRLSVDTPPEEIGYELDDRELAKDTSSITDTTSPPEDQERPRGMRYGLDKVQPVMDKREITQFPERVLQ